MKIYMKPVGMLGTNCYIVADDNGNCAIIDPGASAQRLMAFIEQEKLQPKEILLTHGHFDHIGGAKELAQTYNIPISIGKKNEEQLTDVTKSMANHHMKHSGNYVMQAKRLLSEGDTIQVGDLTFEVLDTPGHTYGCVTYKLEDNLFTGDCLFAGSIGRTDFYGGDYDTIIASIKRLAALPGDYRVFPGHMDATTMDQERKTNPYLQDRPYAALY